MEKLHIFYLNLILFQSLIGDSLDKIDSMLKKLPIMKSAETWNSPYDKTTSSVILVYLHSRTTRIQTIIPTFTLKAVRQHLTISTQEFEVPWNTISPGAIIQIEVTCIEFSCMLILVSYFSISI